MNERPTFDILELVFIANPNYELVLFDRLPAQQRKILKDLRKDPNFYGILRPLEKSSLGVKSVSRDTALLYFTLKEPGRLPEFVRATLGGQCNQEITRLVLDSVLAIERDGKFVSGPEAARLIFGEGEELPAGRTVERLSLEALLYGQSLGLRDPMALSSRLYAYNRTPLSPYWSRILPDADAVAKYLRIQDRPIRELLDREWSSVPNHAAGDSWLAWHSRRSGTRITLGDRGSLLCKLYISPRTEFLPESLPLILNVLTRMRVQHFKIGKDASGLLRPDKMVAYFSSYDHLMATAEELRKELAGCSPQGVPFTAELAGDGLLSWGVDPPPDEQAPPWIGRESWRLWVTNRLAVALIEAGGDNSGSLEPWQFALRRLQLEGVNTRSWIPAEADWKHRCGAEN
ncbi:MAG TPA: hypothetical protein VJA94_20290 [Candidatus Angelobacter sp.]